MPHTDDKPLRTPVGRPPGSNKETTLARLLPVSRRQFAEKGYAQTTFKDVGREAGMTHAALYAYFGSKADLYLATLTDTQQLLLPAYQQAIAEGSNLRERITGIMMASAAAHDRDSTITGFLAAVPIEIRRHPELNTALAQQGSAIFQALTTMFDEAKQRGEIIATASTQQLIYAFLGGGVGVALFQYGMQGESLTDAMAVFVAMIEGKIFM
jgi:AcrR family transcriptional regulator